MREYEPNEDERRALAEALAIEGFQKRRDALRKVAYPVMLNIIDDKDVKEWGNASPLVGVGKVKMRMTVSGLRDQLNEVALANVVMSGHLGMKWVEQALKHPDRVGFESERSKTGYAFGRHSHANSIEEIAKALAGEFGEVKGKDDMNTKTLGKVDLSKIETDKLAVLLLAIGVRVNETSLDTLLAVHLSPKMSDANYRRMVQAGKYIELLEHGEQEELAAAAGAMVTGDVVDDTGVLDWLCNALELEEPEAEEEKKTLSPETAKVVDMILAQAGLGPWAEIEGELNTLRVKTKELTKALDERAKAPGLPATGSVGASGEMPTGNVVLKRAHEVFGVPGDAKASFDFDVPFFEWDGVHPHVPAVDKGYVFKPDLLMSILFALINNDPMWIWGHTGTGKTTAILQVAARLGWPTFRINFDGELTRLDLVGRDTIKQDEGTSVSEFVDGAVPQFMVQPYIMVFDEIDAVRDTVSYVLQRVLENDALVITEDGGRVVHPHPMFRIMATANTCGQGDDTGLYTAVRPQSSALLDRFTRWEKVDYLGVSERAELIRAAAPTLSASDVAMVNAYVGEHLEAFATHGSITLPISPRGYQALAKSLAQYLGTFPKAKRGMAVEMAFSTSILNRANSTDAIVLRGIVDRVKR